MTMPAMDWKPLPVFQDLPALFARPVFSSQSYRLHVTDLANVWVESLDRKGIGRRSLNEDTSIDPTEGPDQMLLLLNKIQAALDPSASDYDQTSICLAALPDDGSGSLALTVTYDLPDGLKPLKWTFRLAKCPVTSIASELVFPLIQAQYIRAREIQDLISSLKEKDNVIDKLVDKLENAGVSLDNVFNALSGKRKLSRESAGQKVKGLAPFNESDWRSGQLLTTETPNDITSLVRTAFLEPIHQEDTEVGAFGDINEWQSKLGHDPITGIRQAHNNEDTKPFKEMRTYSQPAESRFSADDEDDFQVQATPPQLASRRKGRTELDDDATTDDGAETIPDSHPTTSREAKMKLGAIGKRDIAEPQSLNQTSQHRADADDDTASESDDEPVKSLPKKTVASRLGRIGGNPETAKSKAKSPSPNVQISRDDDNTASELDEEQHNKSPSPLAPSSEEQAPKRKLGAIGRIGGKARQTSVEQESGSENPEVVPAKHIGRKIGAIGKRKLDNKRPEIEAPTPALEEPETEDQRAERKRVELAKELERKASAKPTKKKRKF